MISSHSTGASRRAKKSATVEQDFSETKSLKQNENPLVRVGDNSGTTRHGLSHGSFMEATATSQARKKETEDFLNKLHDEQLQQQQYSNYNSNCSRSVESGGSNGSGASRFSKRTVVSAVDTAASRRLSASASAYSETRKQKLALNQTVAAAATVAAANVAATNLVSPYVDEIHSKGRSKRRYSRYRNRDPDSCVTVAIKIFPESDQIPRCIEVKKTAAGSWDEDSVDDIDYVYVHNKIHIFDPMETDECETNREEEFTFDQVFDSNVNHDEIYATTIAPLVESSCCQGINTTIIAYGETATGKTYTFTGPITQEPKHENNSPRSKKNNSNSPLQVTSVSTPQQPKSSKSPHSTSIVPRAVPSSVSCASSVASSLASYATYGEKSGGSVSFHELPVDVGVIPRSLYSIFRLLESMSQAMASDTCKYTFCVRVQFLEIYNDEFRDLLASKSKSMSTTSSVNSKNNGKITLRWIGPDPPQVVGANQPIVSTVNEAWSWLRYGRKRRQTAKTEWNLHSSRSHAIFTILIDQRTELTPTTVDGCVPDVTVQESRSKVNFVDLAAPQRNSLSPEKKVDPIRLKEQCEINQSLLTLRLVIRTLVEQQYKLESTSKKTSPSKRIPYRDSKLTSLLQSSLGGEHRVAMIACVSPAAVNFEHSWECLKYMDRIQYIPSKPLSQMEQTPQGHSDDWSQSCTSTIRTRVTTATSSSKQCSTNHDYETTSLHPVLGLASPKRDALITCSPSSMLITPPRQGTKGQTLEPTGSPRSGSGNSLERTSKKSGSQIAHQTKTSERQRFLSDTSSEGEEDWDAALDAILDEEVDDYILDQQHPNIDVVVVTPSPRGLKQEVVIKESARSQVATPIVSIVDALHVPSLQPSTKGLGQTIATKMQTPHTPANQNRATPATMNSTPTSSDSFNDFRPLIQDLGDCLEQVAEASSEYSESVNVSDISAADLDQKFRELTSDKSKLRISNLPPFAKTSKTKLLPTPISTYQQTKCEADDEIGSSAYDKAPPRMMTTDDYLAFLEDEMTDAAIINPDSSPKLTTSLTTCGNSKESAALMTPSKQKVEMNSQIDAINTSALSGSVGDVSNIDCSFLGISSDESNVATFEDDDDMSKNQTLEFNPLLTFQATKSNSFRFEDDDSLLSFVGLVLLQPNDPDDLKNSTFNVLREMIRISFKNRQWQDTQKNMKDIRDSIYAALDSDTEDNSTLKRILNQYQSKLCDNDDSPLHRLIGYWVCHKQIEDDIDCIDDVEGKGHRKVDMSHNKIHLHQLIGALLLQQEDLGDLEQFMKQIEDIRENYLRCLEVPSKSTNNDESFETRNLTASESQKVKEPPNQSAELRIDLSSENMTRNVEAIRSELITISKMNTSTDLVLIHGLEAVGSHAHCKEDATNQCKISSERNVLKHEQEQASCRTEDTVASTCDPHSTNCVYLDAPISTEVRVSDLSKGSIVTLSKVIHDVVTLSTTLETEGVTWSESECSEDIKLIAPTTESKLNSRSYEDKSTNSKQEEESSRLLVDQPIDNLTCVATDSISYLDKKIETIESTDVHGPQIEILSAALIEDTVAEFVSAEKSNYLDHFPLVVESQTKMPEIQLPTEVGGNRSDEPFSSLERSITEKNELDILKSESAGPQILSVGIGASLSVLATCVGYDQMESQAKTTLDVCKDISPAFKNLEAISDNDGLDIEALPSAEQSSTEESTFLCTKTLPGERKTKEIGEVGLQEDRIMVGSGGSGMGTCFDATTDSPITAKDESVFLYSPTVDFGILSASSPGETNADIVTHRVPDFNEVSPLVVHGKTETAKMQLPIEVGGNKSDEPLSLGKSIPEKNATDTLKSAVPQISSVGTGASPPVLISGIGCVHVESQVELTVKTSKNTPLAFKNLDSVPAYDGLGSDASQSAEQSSTEENTFLYTDKLPGERNSIEIEEDVGSEVDRITSGSDVSGMGTCFDATIAAKDECSDLYLSGPIPRSDIVRKPESELDNLSPFIVHDLVEMAGKPLITEVKNKKSDESITIERSTKTNELDGIKSTGSQLSHVATGVSAASAIGVVGYDQLEKQGEMNFDTNKDTSHDFENLPAVAIHDLDGLDTGVDSIRRTVALEKVKVNMSIRSKSNLNAPTQENNFFQNASEDLMAEPELDHDCSDGQVLKGKLRVVSGLFSDSCMSSDHMQSEFEKEMGGVDCDPCSNSSHDHDTLDAIEEKLRLSQELTEEELALLEMMLETQSVGNDVMDLPKMRCDEVKNMQVKRLVLSPLIDTIRKPDTINESCASRQELNPDCVSLELHNVKAGVEPEPVISYQRYGDSMSQVEIEIERRRQEEFAEALALSCCSITCMGRTIEAYYDYGEQGDPRSGRTLAEGMSNQRKRRSWISRVMGLGESAVAKLPPPSFVGMMPDESRQ